MSERVYGVSDVADPHVFYVYRAATPGKAKTQHMAEFDDSEYVWLLAKRLPWLDDVADINGFEAHKRQLEHGWHIWIGSDDSFTLDDMTDELWEQLKHECEVPHE